MKRKPLRRVDPIEHQIELALNPGAFIGDRSCFSFVSGLDEVAAKIRDLAKIDPARAVTLYETFRAGCYAKVDELDDSSGSFGQFVDGLICAWIKARQASAADPGETATKLLVWMDDDPYGFCYGIEKDAVKVFDKAGLASFEKPIRARFEAATTANPTPGKPLDQPEYLRRRWSEVLRTIYLAQRNISAYVALTGETGLTGRDCHALATMFVTRRKPDEALAWVERGIDLDRKTPHGSTAGYELARLQRELLTRLGRGGEALDAAWADYREHPDKYTYDDLMKLVPKGERQTWHEKALDAVAGTAAKDADLHSLLNLLLETNELQRLADLVRGAADVDLERVTHYATEPAAKKLEKPHPELAARLWRAQAMRIINAKKSKYYAAALSNFERSRRCYERAGLAAEWEETVRQVHACHQRKTGFISDFEALATGRGNAGPPSFLERAKARWGGGGDSGTGPRG